VDINVTDGVNPVTPVSVGIVGNTVTVEVPAASTGWVRNPDWLPLPEITATDNRFVGLFLVFEGEYNQTTVQINNGAANIDWGDGTSVVSDGTIQTKIYNYATLTGTVHQYYDGRNYKQVIIDITELTTVNTFAIDRNNGINNAGINNYADISYSFNASPLISTQRYLLICERFWAYKNGGGALGQNFSFMTKCRVFNYDFSGNTSAQLAFQRFGDIDVFPDIVAPSMTLDSAFSTSNIRQFGLVETVGNTTLNSTWINNLNLRKLPNVQCNAVTNMTNMINGCPNLVEAHFFNCGNVTTVSVNNFASCRSLERLTLQGLTRGFSIANCNMTATALNDLFNSIGTASGSQTIIVTGNPGAATCDTSIATGKGFAVTI